MDEIGQSLLDPSWWFTAVIVAFVVGLAVELAKPRIDNWVRRFAATMRERNQKWKRNFDNEVQRLLDDPIHAVKTEVRRSRYGSTTAMSLVGCAITTAIFFIATSVEFSRGALVGHVVQGDIELMTSLLERWPTARIYTPMYLALVIAFTVLFVNGILFLRTSILLSEYDRRRDSYETSE